MTNLARGLLEPGAADDETRPAVARLLGERLDGLPASGDEGGLEDQVLGRIAGDGELGRDRQVGALPGRLGPGLADQLGVARFMKARLTRPAMLA
jgi:hypothetical protein